MTLDMLLIATGALVVLVAALSARIRRLPVSEPLLALVLGVLVGPDVLRALPLPPVCAAFANPSENGDLTLVELRRSGHGAVDHIPLNVF